MAGFLFHDVIFGPVRSRRLGLSLGINLLPSHEKYCSFNCIYCECGWTPDILAYKPDFPSREIVHQYLEERLIELSSEEYLPQAITFAGNGEPTLHPQFPEIVGDTIILRDKYAPHARVSILSNASMIHHKTIFDALLRIDDNIQKLDAGFETTFLLINNPVVPVNYSGLTENLKKFNGHVIIQSLFLRGIYKDQPVDNAKEDEVVQWLNKIDSIRPELVMIYPIARATPVHSIIKIPIFELEKIAERVKQLGIDVKVYQ
ncbi:MAG: radical SAM protein [Bacteroidetes bacterium]|nr:radical SAM protein [Bacteroidota bacterium]